MLVGDKVAVVSGAGPGLGRSLCLRFAEEGARVVVADLDADAVDQSVEAIVAAGGQAIGAVADICSRAACDEVAVLAKRSFGGIDILVNDAYHGGDNLPFADADLNQWRLTTEVNVFGTLTMIQACLDGLGETGGAVVNICTHGVDVIQPGFGAYTGSKAALAHHTQLLAAELGTLGIRVNSVFPGPIWGANLQAYLNHQADQRGVEHQLVYDEFASKNALGSLVTATEVANAAVFLASDLASAITGQALIVNAGESFR